MTNTEKILAIEDFIDFVKGRLNIQELPKIKFAQDRSWATDRHSFGQYVPAEKTLTVYIGNRNTATFLEH